jgi:hypothetical protein
MAAIALTMAGLRHGRGVAVPVVLVFEAERGDVEEW